MRNYTQKYPLIFTHIYMHFVQYLTMEGCVTFIYVEEYCFNHVRCINLFMLHLFTYVKMCYCFTLPA